MPLLVAHHGGSHSLVHNSTFPSYLPPLLPVFDRLSPGSDEGSAPTGNHRVMITAPAPTGSHVGSMPVMGGISQPSYECSHKQQHQQALDDPLRKRSSQ